MEKALEILKDLKNSYMQNREASSVLGVAYIYTNEENKTNEAIAELEEAMKPKTCEGCKHKSYLDCPCWSYENGQNMLISYCSEFEPKETT